MRGKERVKVCVYKAKKQFANKKKSLQKSNMSQFKMLDYDYSFMQKRKKNIISQFLLI